VLPLIYPHGLSSGDFVPALEQRLGSSAGLAPATVTRLTGQWQADHRAFGERGLTGSDYVYVRADGIDLRIRLAEAKSCVLVVVGVRADGTKELLPQGPHGGVPRNPPPAVLGFKTADVLNALPASAQAVAAFEKTYGVKWPKAARKITDDVDALPAFYDFPAEHWVHLRTTNPPNAPRPSRHDRPQPPSRY
jgi:transposase-like protein